MSVQLHIIITFLMLLICALVLDEWVSVAFVIFMGFLTLGIVTYGDDRFRQFLGR